MDIVTHELHFFFKPTKVYFLVALGVYGKILITVSLGLSISIKVRDLLVLAFYLAFQNFHKFLPQLVMHPV